MSNGDWVLIDAKDILIHIFRPEVRDFYSLEKMWVKKQEEVSPDALEK
jgi:ribosome-associated protein